MTFNEYQDLARRTQNRELTPGERIMHALHGLASEVGEIHGIWQKIYQGHPFNQADVIDEAGDLCWFLAELCDCLQVNMDEVATQNIDKLRKRYPRGFSEYRNLHRD